MSFKHIFCTIFVHISRLKKAQVEAPTKFQGNTEKQKSWKVELLILEDSFCFFHALDNQI